jgi:hypothetical protein
MNRRLSKPGIVYVGSIFVLLIYLGLGVLLVLWLLGKMNANLGFLLASIGAALVSATAIMNAVDAPQGTSVQRRSITAPAALVAFGLALASPMPLLGYYMLAVAAFGFIFWVREFVRDFVMKKG